MPASSAAAADSLVHPEPRPPAPSPRAVVSRGEF